ncbi:MAG: NDP-sugar synthase [Candidatus Aenigmatarchaeota archaeon]
MQVVLLSAGYSLRFYGDKRDGPPKTLYELFPGRRVLDIIIDYFLRKGFSPKDLIICGLEQHENFYVLYRERGISISLEEQPSGTAGAVYNARSLIKDDFIIRNGDTIHEDLNLEEMIELFKKHARVVISAVRRNLPSGYLITENEKVVGFMEKPFSPWLEYAGTSLFPHRFLSFFEGKKSIEEEIFPFLARDEKLYFVESPSGLYLPIDTFKDVEKARSVLKF